MKYYSCKDPHIKALVALKAIKGESTFHLSATYHVNRQDISIWRRQLLREMSVEKWMVDFFAEQSYVFDKGTRKESEPF
jgi:hypothetical protein